MVWDTVVAGSLKKVQALLEIRAALNGSERLHVFLGSDGQVPDAAVID
jgi:hypothetical protein